MARIDAAAYVAYMTGERVERPLFVELFGPLPQTEAEWRAQGATEAEIGLQAFGFDHVPVHHCWVRTGLLSRVEPRVIEDTPVHTIAIDRYGRRTQLCKAAGSLPLPLEYPVASVADWEAIKPQYAFSEERFVAGWDAAARAARERGELLLVSIPGGFDEARQLMGEEMLCLAFYDTPALIADIIATIGATVERVLDRLTAAVPIDNLFIHEDMAGKSGPLLGPNQINEFIAPYYRRCWDLVRSRGTRLFSQDSDGDMRPVMPAFIDAGVNVFLPLEPAAGMDLVAAREAYGPGVGYKGGIDKHALRRDRAAIDAELRYKLQPALQEGGICFGLDHRIPNGVTIDNYRYYVRRARELLGLDPDPEPDWGRMAF